MARALNDVKSRSSRSRLTAARGFCSLGLRDDTPEATRKGYENSHAAKFSCWSEDEGTVDLCGQTVIKHRQTKADSGRNIGGNNALFLSPSHPPGPFISSSNRRGWRRAGLFVKKGKREKTNKQAYSEKSFPDSKAGTGKRESQSSSTSFYLLIKGCLEHFTSTQLCFNMTRWPRICVQNPVHSLWTAKSVFILNITLQKPTQCHCKKTQYGGKEYSSLFCSLEKRHAWLFLPWQYCLFAGCTSTARICSSN